MSEFDWDEGNREHIAPHGILPEEAEQVFANNPVTADRTMEYGVPNYRAYGITDAGRLLTIAWTVREKLIRPITGWPMTKQEKNAMSNKFMKTSKSTTTMPKFKNEREYADWLHTLEGQRHETEQVESGADRPINDQTVVGLLRRASAKRTKLVSIRLPEEDIARAKLLGEKAGLGWQTVLKDIIHQALW